MRYYLSGTCVLKWLELPAVYDIDKDELYELDGEAFGLLRRCAEPGGCAAGPEDREFIDYCLSEGILTSEVSSVKRPPLSRSPVPSLRYLELQITDRCNLKCRHCYIDQPEHNELSIREIEKILNEFEELQGLRLLITGGEPLAHSRFEEVNALLPGYRFRKILFTNGLLLNRKRLEALTMDEIQFSVDGLDHGHDALRGKGTWRMVMRKIEESLAAGIAVSVATMVHRENLDEFGEMEALFKKIGIRDWTVDVPCITGHLKDNPLFQVRPDEAGGYLNYGFGGGLHGGGEGYACGLHLSSVLANGDICKCAFYAQSPAGTIKDGLRNCRANIRPVRLDELECAGLSCRVIDSCRGGCRFRAERAPKGSCAEGAGNILGRDIYKCYGYGIMELPGHEAQD
ncbi:MAG: radical SAM protein [Nitrospirae bacterium]|nr:radical SAM protein [Nitrospirota bacterium]MCL5238602.1 radical SAM protein [Nitrospirota bacterium]